MVLFSLQLAMMKDKKKKMCEQTSHRPQISMWVTSKLSDLVYIDV